MTTSAAPVILFAPGAGAGSESAWMRAWGKRLSALATVEMLDYPYRLAGRKAPDKLPVLVAAHRQALAAVRVRHPAARGTVLVGKSMGGRVGCHVALEERVDALVCLGYPLRGASGVLRDEVLLALKTPILFAQGTRDPLCPLDALATVRHRMSAPNQLFIVEGGNHSLEVARKKKPRPAAEKAGVDDPSDPQEASDCRVMEAITAFIRGALGTAEIAQ